MRPKRASVALVLVAVFVIPAVLTPFSPRVALAATSPQITKISMPNGAGIDPSAQGFSPNVVVVVIGANNTVVWTDNDKSEDAFGYSPNHTVTANDNSFGSTSLSVGDQFNFTFATPGSFPYHCNVHGWMKGQVVVKGTATPSTSSSATTTSTTTLPTTSNLPKTSSTTTSATSTTPEFPLPYLVLLAVLVMAAVALKLGKRNPRGLLDAKTQ